jgi:hypothetical protein
VFATHHIWELYATSRPEVGRTPAQWAARRIVANRDAIFADFKKQSTAAGLSDAQVEGALREFAAAVLAVVREGGAPHPTPTSCQKSATATVAAYLGIRVCVPRDMGRPVADCYHTALRALVFP